MKHVQKKLAIIFLSLLMTTNAHAWGSKRPSTPVTPKPPVVVPPVVVVPTGPYIDQVQALAAGSACASYSWANRGKAPSAYMKGMALTFARSLCRLKASEETPSGIAALLSGARGLASKDALTHYQSNISALGIDTSVSGVGSLRALYTLGIGLGMRESSGKYCEGRDMSASNTSATTAEAGMFQTSYNAMSSSPELGKIYAEYKANPSKCHLNVFKVGISCSSASIYGSGEGATYQALNKSCPAFAAESAMMVLRVLRAHYGPINRKEAEVTSACNKMLLSVQELIENDPNACDDLI